MKNLWNDNEATTFVGDLAQRVYSSRLLGADSTLVMHGGGNTSVKSRLEDIFGEEEEVMFVKGSGSDLATIEPAGFSPCRIAICCGSRNSNPFRTHGWPSNSGRA